MSNVSEVDFKTFDLADALAGISYPEVTFPVFFDARTAHEITLKNRELDAANSALPEFKEKEKEFMDLLDKARSSKYTFTIRGINHERRSEAVDLVMKEIISLPEGDQRAFAEKNAETRLRHIYWSAHIVKIEDPNGAVKTAITEEEAKALFNQLPDPSREEVERQIDKMVDDLSLGYQITVSDFDFLSEASPEE